MLVDISETENAWSVNLEIHSKIIPVYWCDQGKFYLPQLYIRDKLGRLSFWRVYVKDDSIYSESGIDGGKIKCSPGKKALPKNVGKANQTTANDQALLEAFSLWKKKQDAQYHEKDQLTGDNDTEKKEVSYFRSLRPALAQSYDKCKHQLKLPFGISEKIDGIRAIGFLENNKVELVSRNGKAYFWMAKLREELQDFMNIHSDIAIDGELYNHQMTFSQISSIVKKGNTKSCSQGDDLIEYWIFDLFMCDTKYTDRMIKLKEWEKIHRKKYPEPSRLKFIYYDTITDHEQVKAKCEEYMANGFEGAILRNLNALYKLKHRSADLQKYKQFNDTEYQVVDMEQGSGLETGCAIYICEIPEGTKFSVRPKGTHEERKEIFKNKDEYIGKMLTVRYQELSEYNVPRFPVGIAIRDYE